MQPIIEQPQFVLEPKSSFLFENRPVQLECKAIRTRQIFFIVTINGYRNMNIQNRLKQM
jgi:hypothetical protein